MTDQPVSARDATTNGDWGAFFSERNLAPRPLLQQTGEVIHCGQHIRLYELGEVFCEDAPDLFDEIKRLGLGSDTIAVRGFVPEDGVTYDATDDYGDLLWLVGMDRDEHYRPYMVFVIDAPAHDAEIERSLADDHATSVGLESS